MKRILFCLFIVLSLAAKAQVYNNEWIDHNKTYYKFKIDSSAGIRRIAQPALASIGLGNIPAEHFQLWRNGVQVPIYTSVTNGPLSPTDYIEFLGEMNDGKPDRPLYRKPEFLLNDKWSLQTDSASYFLTINTAGNNLRLSQTTNNISGNSLPAEPFFMHTAGIYFRDRIHGGYAVNVDNTYLYSSAYDKGEGWASNDITTNATSGGVNYGTHSLTINNLFPYSSGPSPKIKIAVSGNAVNTRQYKVSINGDSVLGNSVDYFNYTIDSANFNLSSISSGTATIAVTNRANVACYPAPVGCQVDRLVIHQYELTYPRRFNFGGASNFEFALPASSSGNYLEIAGFSYGSTPPVLYDLTNGKRYTADISSAPLVKVVLEPSAVQRRLVLISTEPAKIKAVTSFTQRVFTNYALPQSQGDYLIVSNSLLFTASNGRNPVEDYRAYRSSINGGSHDAKIYLIDELIDQFAFGIKSHPLGIRNFIHYAKASFSKTPQNVLLIGKGVTYVEQRYSESNALMDKLNLVPTFGVPASDNLLSAAQGNAIPEIPVGRISAVSADEVSVYLEKLKQFEGAQLATSPNISDRAWMKNVVHVVGAEGDLTNTLNNYMNSYKAIIADSLYGGNVHLFSKKTASAVEVLNSKYLENLFAEGISLLTYFGHSGSTNLAYNMEEPSKYNNVGKYPLFVALGCNAGSMFSFTTARNGLSEMYVLAPQKGTIGFLASTHYGIVYYMDVWNSIFYKKIGRETYDKSVGEAMKGTAIDVFKVFSQEDFYLRSTIEQMQLHGDPALKINPHPKPDYAIEDAMAKVNPSFISVASGSFNVQAKFMNIGKATNKDIVIEIKRKYPDQSIGVVFRDTIKGIKYADSINVNIPIDPLKDKGANSLTINIDADDEVDELFESNNSITKEFVVFEDEAKPIYPYNFAIINQPLTKLAFSSANPFSESKNYTVEIDTTEFFNSPIKVTKSVASVGGVVEIEPGINLVDKTVYYWRVGVVPATGAINWNNFSFTYLANHDVGFNMSGDYQHLKSAGRQIYFDSTTRNWKYSTFANRFVIRNSIFPTSGTLREDFSTFINDVTEIEGGCTYDELIFNIFHPETLKPVLNPGNKYGSFNNCGGRRTYNFEFLLNSVAERKKIIDFLDSIPAGYYVSVRGNVNPNMTGNTYPNVWKSDTAIYGSNNSLYHKLFQQGIEDLDSFYFPRTFVLFYKKNEKHIFTPSTLYSKGITDKIELDLQVKTSYPNGTITSPDFGPSRSWKKLYWDGTSLENTSSDNASISILGRNKNGITDTLMSNIGFNQKEVDISSISATQYPYLSLSMKNVDNENFSPYQLDYWKIIYDAVPEGAIAPNIFFKMKDTLDVGEPLDFKIAFKNVSSVPFDSLLVKFVVTPANNTNIVLPLVRLKPVIIGDTLHVRYMIDTKQLIGLNNLFVDVNPNEDQPEQYHFNNFIYKQFYVRTDSLSPMLDVTFDNVHILNRDIVSSKPDILIKLKDENVKYLLSDTSIAKVQLKYPREPKPREMYFDGVTMRFQAPQTGTDNVATINLKPTLVEDGEYELIVTAQDAVGNSAGTGDYKIAFQVLNKPMISNLLTYPNPFTTSTAFVFTLTGSEVPQNIRIQILTVTGKVVKEITKDELGPLRIGRNITEYKWDGTDQYGQKLANGVYLYRVITNLNGKSLDKYKSESDDTDKYFNKGYGKMYLMR